LSMSYTAARCFSEAAPPPTSSGVLLVSGVSLLREHLSGACRAASCPRRKAIKKKSPLVDRRLPRSGMRKPVPSRRKLFSVNQRRYSRRRRRAVPALRPFSCLKMRAIKPGERASHPRKGAFARQQTLSRDELRAVPLQQRAVSSRSSYSLIPLRGATQSPTDFQVVCA
jgi:hypothetical protein